MPRCRQALTESVITEFADACMPQQASVCYIELIWWRLRDKNMKCNMIAVTLVTVELVWSLLLNWYLFRARASVTVILASDGNHIRPCYGFQQHEFSFPSFVCLLIFRFICFSRVLNYCKYFIVGMRVWKYRLDIYMWIRSSYDYFFSNLYRNIYC